MLYRISLAKLVAVMGLHQASQFLQFHLGAYCRLFIATFNKIIVYSFCSIIFNSL